jgi:hypothetical protein
MLKTETFYFSSTKRNSVKGRAQKWNVMDEDKGNPLRSWKLQYDRYAEEFSGKIVTKLKDKPRSAIDIESVRFGLLGCDDLCVNAGRAMSKPGGTGKKRF